MYDNARAFSLRDRDDAPYEIDDKPNVTRCRLNCYAAENLILSNEVLESLGINWTQLKEKINQWLRNNTSHSKFNNMQTFAQSFDRQNAKVKELRLIFIDLADSNKPWEVVVGQAIAKLKTESDLSAGSLVDFLGNKLVTALNLCS